MAKKKDNPDASADMFADLAKDIGGEVLGMTDAVKEWIDTGNLALNYLCSGRFVGGGIPSGKIIEVYGPSSSCKTLFATNILKGCQKMGGYSLFLDAENSLSKDFAQKASHLETSKVLVLKAESLQKAFAKMIAAIKKIREKFGPDKPIVIVYDSIAASPSDREMAETDMSESELEKAKDMPGERAKTCSKELRKLTPLLDQHNCTVLFINQVRMKIGVMFGCFSGRSKVLLADGTWKKIGEIVNGKLPVELMSVNPTTGLVSAKRVTGWHKNGTVSEDGSRFLKIVFRRPFQQGVGAMVVTPNHRVFLPHEGDIREVAAGDVKVGQELSVATVRYLDEDRLQVVYGSILGDGSVRSTGVNRLTATLRLRHGSLQKDYLEYKRGLFGGLGNTTRPSKTGRAWFWDSPCLEELQKFSHYRDDYLISDEIAGGLNELGLAIWYLDDGTYGGSHKKCGSGKSRIYCYKWNNKEIMLSAFHRMGLRPTVDDKGFLFDSTNTIRLHTLIARFVPPSMNYKIHPSCHGLFDYNPPALSPRWETCSGAVTDISMFDHTKFSGDDIKYDLTVEDNETYVVGGAFVHNSPETTAGGGKALEYYTSLRLRTKAEKRFTDKLDNVIGIGVSVSNVKNKCFRPFINARNMQLLFDQGINPFGGLLELLVQTERITPCGSGSYKVSEPYAGGQEIKFKSALERNDVPAEVLLKCPAMVDATDVSQVQEYIDIFGGAMRGMNDRVTGEEDVKNSDEE